MPRVFRSDYIVFAADVDRCRSGKCSDQNKAGGAQHMGWQASKSTLRERFAYLYCNETLADVWFVVGRDEHTKVCISNPLFSVLVPVCS